MLFLYVPNKTGFVTEFAVHDLKLIFKVSNFGPESYFELVEYDLALVFLSQKASSNYELKHVNSQGLMY